MSSNDTASLLADAATLLPVPRLLLAVIVVGILLAVVAVVVLLLLFHCGLPMPVRLAYNLGAADYMISYTGGADVVYHVNLQTKWERLNQAIARALLAVWTALTSIIVGFVSALISVATSIWERLPLWITLFILATIAFVWIESHPVLIQGYLGVRQSTVWPALESTVYPILNSVRALVAAIIPINNAFWRISSFLVSGSVRLLIHLITAETVLAFLDDVVNALFLTVDALTTFLAAGLFTARIELVPPLVAIGAIPQEHFLPLLDGACGALHIIWLPVVELPAKPSLHGAIDCGANVVIRAFQVISRFIFDLLGGNGLALPDIQPLITEIECFTFSLGDFAEDVVDEVVALAVAALDLATSGVSIELSALKSTTAASSSATGAPIRATQAFATLIVAAARASAAGVSAPLSPAGGADGGGFPYTLGHLLMLEEPRYTPGVNGSAPTIRARRAPPSLGEVQWSLRHRPVSVSELRLRASSLFDFNTGFPALDTLLRDILGFEGLTRLADAPWSRAISGSVVTVVRAVNMTVSIAFNIVTIDEGGPGVAHSYVQTRPIFDAARIAADGLSQIGILFDPTLPCALREALEILLGTAESIIDIVVMWIIALIYPSWTIGENSPCLSAPDPATACKVIPPDTWTPLDYLADYFGQADNAVLRMLQNADASLDCSAVVLGCDTSNTTALNGGSSSTTIDCQEAILVCIAHRIGRLIVTLVRTALTIIFYLPDLIRFNAAYRTFADITLTPITDDISAVFECVRRFLVFFGDPDVFEIDPAAACLSADGLGRLPPNLNATRPIQTPTRFIPPKASYDCGVDGRAYYANDNVFQIQLPVIVRTVDGVGLEHLPCNEAHRLLASGPGTTLRDFCVSTRASLPSSSPFPSEIRLVGLALSWLLQYTGNSLDVADTTVAFRTHYEPPDAIIIGAVTAGPGADVQPPLPTVPINCTSTLPIEESEGTPLPAGYACFANGLAWYGSMARPDNPAYAALSPLTLGFGAAAPQAQCGNIGTQVPGDTATYSMTDNITCINDYLHIQTLSGDLQLGYVAVNLNVPFVVPLSCGADGMAATRIFCRFNEMFSYQPTPDNTSFATLTMAPVRLTGPSLETVPLRCNLRPIGARPPCLQCDGGVLGASTDADAGIFSCNASTPRTFLVHNATQSLLGGLFEGDCQGQTRFQRPHCASINVDIVDQFAVVHTLRAEFNYLDSADPVSDVMARYYSGNERLPAVCEYSLFDLTGGGAAITTSGASAKNATLVETYGMTPGMLQLMAASNDRAIYEQASFEDGMRVATLRAHARSWRGRTMLRAERLRDLDAVGRGPIVPEDTLYRYGMESDALARYDAARAASQQQYVGRNSSANMTEAEQVLAVIAAGGQIYYKQTFLCSLAGTVNATVTTATSFTAEVLDFLRDLAIVAATPSIPPDVPTFAESVAALHDAVCALAVTVTRILPADFTCSFTPSSSTPACNTSALCASHLLCDAGDAILTPLDILSDILATVKFFVGNGGDAAPLFGSGCNEQNLDVCFENLLQYIIAKVAYIITNLARSLAAFVDCILCYFLLGGAAGTDCIPLVYSIVDPIATLVDGLLNDVLITLIKIVISLITWFIQLISGAIEEFFSELGHFFELLLELIADFGEVLLGFFRELPIIGDILNVIIIIVRFICDTLQEIVNAFADPDYDIGCGNVSKKKRGAPGEGWLPSLPAATRAAWANPGSAAQCRQRIAEWNDTRGAATELLPGERREFLYCISLVAWLPESRGGRLPDSVANATMPAGCDHYMSALLFGTTADVGATAPVNEHAWSTLSAVEQARVIECASARLPVEYVRLRNPGYAGILRHDFFYNFPYSLALALEDGLRGYRIYSQYAADRAQPGQVLLSRAYQDDWTQRDYPTTHLDALRTSVAAVASMPPPPVANRSSDLLAAAADRYYAQPVVRAALEAERRMLEDSAPDGLQLDDYARRFMQHASLQAHSPFTGDATVVASPQAAELAALAFSRFWRRLFTGRGPAWTPAADDEAQKRQADNSAHHQRTPLGQLVRNALERLARRNPAATAPRLNVAAMMGGARAVGDSDTDAAAAKRARSRAVRSGLEALFRDVPAIGAKLLLFATDHGSDALSAAPSATYNLTRALYYAGTAMIHASAEALGAGRIVRMLQADTEDGIWASGANGNNNHTDERRVRSIWARPSDIFPGARSDQSMLGAAMSSLWAMRERAKPKSPTLRGATFDVGAALWNEVAAQHDAPRTRAARFVGTLMGAVSQEWNTRRPTTTTRHGSVQPAAAATAPLLGTAEVVCAPGDPLVTNGSCETCYLTLCQECLYADRAVAAILGSVLQVSEYYTTPASDSEASYPYTQQEQMSLRDYLRDRDTPIRLGDSTTVVLPLVWPSPDHSYLRLFADGSPKMGVDDYAELVDRALALLSTAPTNILDALLEFFDIGGGNLLADPPVANASSSATPVVTARHARVCNTHDPVGICSAKAMVSSGWRAIGRAMTRRRNTPPRLSVGGNATAVPTPTTTLRRNFALVPSLKRAVAAIPPNDTFSAVAYDALNLLYETFIRCGYTSDLDGTNKRFSLAEAIFILLAGLVLVNAIVIVARIPIESSTLNMLIAMAALPLLGLLAYDRSFSCGLAIPLQAPNDVMDLLVNTVYPRCSPYLSGFILNSNEYTPDTCHIPEAYTGGDAGAGVPNFVVGDCVDDAGFYDFGYDLAFLLEVAFPDVQDALREAGDVFPLLGVLLRLPAISERIAYWEERVAAVGGDFANDPYLYARLYDCFWAMIPAHAVIFALIVTIALTLAVPLAMQIWNVIGALLVLGVQGFFVAYYALLAICATLRLGQSALNPDDETFEGMARRAELQKQRLRQRAADAAAAAQGAGPTPGMSAAATTSSSGGFEYDDTRAVELQPMVSS